MRKIIILSAFVIALSGGCAHKPEIQQGNVVTEEQLQNVQVGMQPRQVVFLLGTPLLRDPFHENRWDYYYRLEQDGEQKLMYRVTLTFRDERLASIDKSGPIPADERAALKLLRDEPR
jgi:outer membrane protein assembly factor BamE